MQTEERASDIAETFPTLRGKRGVRPWHPPTLLAEWPYLSHGAVQAALFMLNVVWGCRVDDNGEALPPFDIRRAFNAWDDTHQAAWKAWAVKPTFL